MEKENILQIKDLKISFKYDNKNVQIIRGVDINICRGEIVGILGESGSGKTVTCTSILGLTKEDDASIDAGTIMYKNTNLLNYSERDYRKLRGKDISYIFQNAAIALNPYRKIGKQIAEIYKTHHINYSKDLIISLLRELGIEGDDAEIVYNKYPFQLSGGQCQRIMIAMSVALNPDILIADEPTSSIDSSLQKKVLELLKSINLKNGTSIIIITHDFDVAKYICDKIVIMYGGLVMEEGDMKDVLENPLHPYTSALLKCAESIHAKDKMLYTLEGRAQGPLEFKNECPFVDRCQVRREICIRSVPELIELENGRKVRCIRI